MDGVGVLHVPENLAPPAAGDVAPLHRGVGVPLGDAPPLPRKADGGAVPAGEQGQPPVGDHEASARVEGARRQAESLQGVDLLRSPLGRDAQQPGQVSQGDPRPVGDGVETITDLLMMDLFVQSSTVALFRQTSKPDEAMWGTDFELWLGSERLGWFRFAIQAKKLDLRTDRYASLTQSNVNGSQIDLLEQYAQHKRAAPLYCLYNRTDGADVLDHWHCCTPPADLKELGCSVTPLSNIATAIGEWGGKNFDSIHKNESTLPWKCLVSCPKVWYLLQVKSGNEIGSPIIQETPLFDPDSCYHETLPMVLRMEDQPAIVRRSERGGSLI